VSICGYEHNVADCCRCVAGGKGQRNPCKIRLVAVLPIFLTSIHQSCLSLIRWLIVFSLMKVEFGSFLPVRSAAKGNNFPFKSLQYFQNAVFGPFSRWHGDC
jgi:hypothetical protein